MMKKHFCLSAHVHVRVDVGGSPSEPIEVQDPCAEASTLTEINFALSTAMKKHFLRAHVHVRVDVGGSPSEPIEVQDPCAGAAMFIENHLHCQQP